jgi:hypothetical protein
LNYSRILPFSVGGSIRANQMATNPKHLSIALIIGSALRKDTVVVVVISTYRNVDQDTHMRFKFKSAPLFYRTSARYYNPVMLIHSAHKPLQKLPSIPASLNIARILPKISHFSTPLPNQVFFLSAQTLPLKNCSSNNPKNH